MKFDENKSNRQIRIFVKNKNHTPFCSSDNMKDLILIFWRYEE